MAVEIKYVVVRDGEEKMSFANKKDADAWDKMLDLADVFGDWLQQSPLSLDDEQSDKLGMWLAENRDALSTILKTGQLPDAASKAEKPAASASKKETVEVNADDVKSADVKPIKAA